MNLILKQTFEQTYSAAIDDAHPYISFIYGFLGSQEKFRRDENGMVEEYFDWKLWNIGEQLFFIPRILKNILKIGTEGIWNAAALSLNAAGDASLKKVDFNVPTNWNHSYNFAGYLLKVLSYIPWTIATIGQSITSPFAAMKNTYKSATQFSGGLRPIGAILAGLQGAFSLAALSTALLFAAPYMGFALMASGNFGTSLVAYSLPVVNWLGSLPGLSTLGTYIATAANLVANVTGLTLLQGFVSTATLAAASIVALPVLSGLRIFLRKILPWDRDRKQDPQDPLLNPNSQETKPGFFTRMKQGLQNLFHKQPQTGVHQVPGPLFEGHRRVLASSSLGDEGSQAPSPPRHGLDFLTSPHAEERQTVQAARLRARRSSFENRASTGGAARAAASDIAGPTHLGTSSAAIATGLLNSSHQGKKGVLRPIYPPLHSPEALDLPTTVFPTSSASSHSHHPAKTTAGGISHDGSQPRKPVSRTLSAEEAAKSSSPTSAPATSPTTLSFLTNLRQENAEKKQTVQSPSQQSVVVSPKAASSL